MAEGKTDMSNIRMTVHDALRIKVKPVAYLADYNGKPAYTQEVFIETEDGINSFVAFFADAVNERIRKEEQEAEKEKQYIEAKHHMA